LFSYYGYYYLSDGITTLLGGLVLGLLVSLFGGFVGEAAACFAVLYVGL
jgi:hypothetical protein